MAFFEKLGDTIVSVGKDVTQKAKDVSGIAKLRLDIKSKEDFIREQYQEIGRAYFEAHRGEAVQEQAQFDRIEEAMEAVAQMEQKILELKKVRVCQECGAEAADTADFCSVCGARLVIVAEDAFYEEADTKEQKKEDDIQIP